MTIAYRWGRHLARHKKGVHSCSGAGFMPNDRHTSASNTHRYAEMCTHRNSEESDVLLPNPCDSCSRPLVAVIRSSESTQGKDGADLQPSGQQASGSLGFPVHPHLLSDLHLTKHQLHALYRGFPRDFQVRVTVFGVQRSLDYFQVRVCLADLGLAGFGSGVMRRKGTKLHLTLPRAAATLVAVHGVDLISRAMRREYGWRCVLHPDNLISPPSRCLQPMLHNRQIPKRYISQIVPWQSLCVGTWNLEGLNSARKQQEVACMLDSLGLIL